nr:hypothetical protein [Tanacetum cinerariifolium]
MKNHESRPIGSAPLSEANVATYNQSGGRDRGSNLGRGRDRGCGRGHESGFDRGNYHGFQFRNISGHKKWQEKGKMIKNNGGEKAKGAVEMDVTDVFGIDSLCVDNLGGPEDPNDITHLDVGDFLANENANAYKEYYACATGEAAPKPKASARRKRSGSDTSITPPTAIITPTTTVAVTPRLTAAAKGKQPAKAKSPSDPSELARTEAQQLKIVLRRRRQETHISHLGGFSTDEGTGSKPRVLDVPSDDSE